MSSEHSAPKHRSRPVLAEAPSDELGRLTAKIAALERELASEREKRRRIAALVRRERQAAAAIHARAAQAEDKLAALRHELDVSREAQDTSGKELHQTWIRLAEAEHELRLAQRPLWRKLLGLQPRGAAP